MPKIIVRHKPEPLPIFTAFLHKAKFILPLVGLRSDYSPKLSSPKFYMHFLSLPFQLHDNLIETSSDSDIFKLLNSLLFNILTPLSVSSLLSPDQFTCRLFSFFKIRNPNNHLMHLSWGYGKDLTWTPNSMVLVLERTIPTAACRRSDCQLLRIEGATWSAWRIPTAVFSVF
jgi:hypothetical protein